MNVRVQEVRDEMGELVKITTPTAKYEVREDTATGDWVAYSESDMSVGQRYLLTRDGAIQFVLEKCGVLTEATYELAPDRTSA